jgi:excisionase family DNA binding protein
MNDLADGTRSIFAERPAATMERDTVDLINIEEFAKRLQVSRTTVFDWIKKGKLLPGRHFIKVGRVIRFEWGPDLVKKLHEVSDVPSEASHDIKPQPTRSSRTSARRKAAIDLNY